MSTERIKLHQNKWTRKKILFINIKARKKNNLIISKSKKNKIKLNMKWNSDDWIIIIITTITAEVIMIMMMIIIINNRIQWEEKKMMAKINVIWYHYIVPIDYYTSNCIWQMKLFHHELDLRKFLPLIFIITDDDDRSDSWILWIWILKIWNRISF